MKRISVITFIILFGISCSEDFLDRQPQAELTENSFLTNENDAVLATNAVYNTLRIWFYHYGGFPVIQIMSDDATKGSNPGDGTQILPFEDFSFTTTENSILRWYTTLYQGIRRANVVIEQVPQISMDEQLQTRLIAEARFLRAMFYFELVRAYGGVPKVTTTTPELQIPRSPKQEIYDEIIFPDLDFAASNLPFKSEYDSEDLGRATKGAANGLRAQIYLFEGDFGMAEQYALEVINSGQYALDPDYSNVFSVDGELGSGSIFEIPALPDNFGNGGNQYANTQAIRGEPNRGWGFCRPSWDLINFYESDDPRMDATVTFLGEVLDGITIIGDNNTPDTTYNDQNEIIAVECYNQKIWTPGTTTLESFGHNRRLIRYGEILLIAAESLNENGKPDQALTYLNMVRERAREGNDSILPDVTTTNQAELREAIYRERRAELAMEGYRFFDLVRTGRAVDVLGPLGFQSGKHELLPIPQAEIDLSQGILTQNPGW